MLEYRSFLGLQVVNIASYTRDSNLTDKIRNNQVHSFEIEHICKSQQSTILNCVDLLLLLFL